MTWTKETTKEQIKNAWKILNHTRNRKQEKKKKKNEGYGKHV
jgi:hypothetical protein